MTGGALERGAGDRGEQLTYLRLYTTWHYTKTENLCCLPLNSASGSEKSHLHTKRLCLDHAYTNIHFCLFRTWMHRWTFPAIPVFYLCWFLLYTQLIRFRGIGHIYLYLLPNGHWHKLTRINVVDDVVERRRVDFRDADLGWHGNAADVTRWQHGGQVVGRGAEYQPMSWYTSLSRRQHDVAQLSRQQIVVKQRNV